MQARQLTRGGNVVKKGALREGGTCFEEKKGVSTAVTKKKVQAR